MHLRAKLLLSFSCLGILGPHVPLAHAVMFAIRAPAEEPATSAAIPAPHPDGKSFEDVFNLSLQHADVVNVQDELLYQANEVNRQAVGTMLPAVNGSYNFTQQESPSTPVGTSISPSSQQTLKLTADQPLFRGFRDFALLRQRKDIFNGQKAALQSAALQLFYSAATAYYNLLQLESDDFNYRNEIDINRKRLGELENFVRIGRSQITDVLTQKSTISSLEATLESTDGQLELAKDTLAFYTGQNREMPLRDTVTPPAKPEPIISYLEKIEQRPDVSSSLEALRGNEEGVPIAWGQHLPSIDALGDYYLDRPPGALSGVSWDVGVAVTIPIFQGGVILSQTRQAVSVARQYSMQLSQTRRSAELEIRTYYDNFVSDQKQVSKLEETVEISKKNYEAQIKNYRDGLVTNLDVLQAITTWQDALRTFARQQYSARMDYIKLLAASAQRKEVFVESATLK